METGKGLYRDEKGWYESGIDKGGGARTVADIMKEVVEGNIVFAEDAVIVFAGCNCGGEPANPQAGRHEVPADASLAHVMAERLGVTTIGSFGGSQPASQQDGAARTSLGKGWYRFEPKTKPDGTRNVKPTRLGPQLHPVNVLRQENAK